jgi:transmembrane sensor
MKNRPDNKTILSPHEKLIVANETAREGSAIKVVKQAAPTAISINKLQVIDEDSAVAETQWVVNKLVFNDESFAEVAKKMERWYDVEVELSDPQLQLKRLTGNFEKETIGQALEALKLTLPFKYEQTGNKILIHR